MPAGLGNSIAGARSAKPEIIGEPEAIGEPADRAALDSGEKEDEADANSPKALGWIALENVERDGEAEGNEPKGKSGISGAENGEAAPCKGLVKAARGETKSPAVGALHASPADKF
jgi:hypothetical protein